MIIIKNVSIFDGIAIKKNKNVIIDNSKIIDIKNSNQTAPHHSNKVKIIDGKDNFLIPGFIDIQVNGGGGYCFNREPTADALQKIFNAHLKFGTTSIFPTFISDSAEVLKKCILLLEKNYSNKNFGIAGFHIEGPWLNKEKRGIHPEKNIVPVSNEILNILFNIKIPACIVTLAPEMVQPNIIKSLVNKGIYVFAGHTNASAREMKQSFKYGVSGVTHLFNACSQIMSRDVGVVGAGLLEKDILCSLIVDGIHVSYDALKIAFKVKDPKKFILISDAMEPVGTSIKEFKIFNEKIYVNKNTLKNEEGTLSGANLTMLFAFQNLMKKKLVKIEEAILMSSTNQAEYFGFKEKGAILPGYDANVILIDKKKFSLLEVIFLGKCSRSQNN